MKENEESDAGTLPQYSTELKTRLLCIVGVVTCTIFSLVAVGLAIPAFVKTHNFQNDETVTIAKSNAVREVTAFFLNVGVTIFTEVLGYPHSVSLRWALSREGRLSANSNLRLFTIAKHCPANSWYANSLWVLLITLSYSTASQIIQPTGSDIYTLNSQALFLLGVALLGQCALATWCMIGNTTNEILSYNSSALNTTLALLHRDVAAPVSDKAVVPHNRQHRAARTTKAVRWTVIYVWTLTFLIVLWSIVIQVVSSSLNGPSDSGLNPQTHKTGVYPSSGTTGIQVLDNIWRFQSLIGLGVISAMQILNTLALHSAEEIINLSRDESLWRRAANLSPGSKGAPISQSAIISALTDWQSILLLIIKPVSHWFFGSSAATFADGYLAFHATPIFCLAGVNAVLAATITYLGYRKPKGFQPSTWGNVLKLAEHVDCWGVGAGGYIFWGDKGPIGADGVRKAGTSGSKDDLGPILDGYLYRGIE